MPTKEYKIMFLNDGKSSEISRFTKSATGWAVELLLASGATEIQIKVIDLTQPQPCTP